MSDLTLVHDVAIALGLALLGGFAAHRLRLSPIVGYLLAGAAVSPFTPGYSADLHTLRQLAELGVIFLMFGVGLHFDVRGLVAVATMAVPVALMKMALVGALTLGIGLATDLDWREALVLGVALAISSTVVLIRAFGERGLLEAPVGRLAIGWLIVEDIVTVAILVVLPSLAPGAGDHVGQDLALALLKAAAFLAVMLVAGARLVPWILELVSRTGSRELFVVAVVAGTMGIATGAEWFGLSLALGAFVAGLVIAESESSHQAAAAVLPFREAFAVLFFVSVGMLLDPAVLREHVGLLFVALGVVVAAKALVSLAVTAASPCPLDSALLIAAGMAQAGEFSFIVADQALDLRLMSNGTYNVVLAVAALSIALNPIAFRLAEVRPRRQLPA